MPPIPTRAITIIGFVLLVVAMIVLEILARRPGSLGIPAVGQWLGYLMRPKLGLVLDPARLVVARLALLRQVRRFTPGHTDGRAAGPPPGGPRRRVLQAIRVMAMRTAVSQEATAR